MRMLSQHPILVSDWAACMPGRNRVIDRYNSRSPTENWNSHKKLDLALSCLYTFSDRSVSLTLSILTVHDSHCYNKKESHPRRNKICLYRILKTYFRAFFESYFSRSNSRYDIANQEKLFSWCDYSLNSQIVFHQCYFFKWSSDMHCVVVCGLVSQADHEGSTLIQTKLFAKMVLATVSFFTLMHCLFQCAAYERLENIQKYYE